MATKYYQLKVTEKELLAIIDIFDTVEGSLGCSDSEDNETTPDDEGKAGLKAFDKVMKRNGLSR